MVAYAKQKVNTKPYITPQEYLEREEQAETKSEYWDGEIVAMSGASEAHVTITVNISGELYAQLRGQKCRLFGSDLRVLVESCDAYYYPDLTVACDPPQFLNIASATLLNPTLIVEVLSDSTEAKDRGEKWSCYQTLESLSTYILAAQDRPYIETYFRQPDGSWRYEAVKGLDAALKLETIGCELRLAEVYANIEFLR